SHEELGGDVPCRGRHTEDVAGEHRAAEGHEDLPLPWSEHGSRGSAPGDVLLDGTGPGRPVHQASGAHPHLVSVLERPAAGDACAVDERSIATAEVLDTPARAEALEHRVQSRGV